MELVNRFKERLIKNFSIISNYEGGFLDILIYFDMLISIKIVGMLNTCLLIFLDLGN